VEHGKNNNRVDPDNEEDAIGKPSSEKHDGPLDLGEHA
jgi:hypothetical protein